VTCIDALSRERALTGGGRDNSIRIWKIVEESQLVYNGHYNGNIDAVKLSNEENFISGGEDGTLCTWNVNRKKPSLHSGSIPWQVQVRRVSRR
jgi:ribosomal RNA-processing protein 9